MELNFGRTYSFFLKISEYDMNKFTKVRWVERTSPLYVHIILNEYQEHIYIELEILTEFPLQVEIEAYNTRDIYNMNFTRLAQPQQATRWT